MRISDWSSDVCSSDLMHDKADAAARLERQVAEQRTAMEQAARAERQQLADQFEREVMSIVEAVQESAQTLHGNAATMSHEIEAVHGKADSVAAAAHQDRESVGMGKSVSGSCELGGRRFNKNKKR